MQIVFQNSHFIVVNKPAGTLSVPSRFSKDDHRIVVGRELEKSLGVRLWPCHRLDFEVSGLLIFAKGAQSHKAANLWFEQGLVQKTYQAVVEPAKKTNGIELPKTGHQERWESYLVKGKKRAFEASYGKHSVTDAEYRGVDNIGRMHWLLRPVTGRSHQLRFELFKRGTPIVGDHLYGALTPFSSEGGIALRAVELSFAKCAEDSRKYHLQEIVTLNSDLRLF